MPVRKIPKNYRSITGKLSKHDGTGSAGFESALERDAYTLFAFHPEYQALEEQPVRISYLGSDQKSHSYVPDALVTFKNDTRVLVEVKYVAELQRLIKEEGYAERIRAVRQFAHEQGWRFRVYTERDIRTPRLLNARFLLTYRSRAVPANDGEKIIALLRTTAPLSVHTLLEHLSAGDRMARARLVVAVWHLIAHHRLRVDLNVPLNDHSVIQGVT